MDDGRKSIARIEAVRQGEVFIDHHLVILRRVGQPAFLDIESIQKGLAVIGERK